MCHSQVIVPHSTQSYTDSTDPPEETFALCTLKSFPYQIEHTIQWAREYFETFIAKPSQDLKKFYEDKKGFLDAVVAENKQNPTIAIQRLETVKGMWEGNETQRYSKCVEMAVNMFWDVFHNQIISLLSAFP
jgi:ubiquitin-activating enzyme E1